MLDAATQTDLLSQVGQLPPALQRKVVDFAHALAQSMPRRTPARELLEFAGIFNAEDAEAMISAIERDCERIDPNDW